MRFRIGTMAFELGVLSDRKLETVSPEIICQSVDYESFKSFKSFMRS